MYRLRLQATSLEFDSKSVDQMVLSQSIVMLRGGCFIDILPSVVGNR